MWPDVPHTMYSYVSANVVEEVQLFLAPMVFSFKDHRVHPIYWALKHSLARIPEFLLSTTNILTLWGTCLRATDDLHMLLKGACLCERACLCITSVMREKAHEECVSECEGRRGWLFETWPRRPVGPMKGSFHVPFRSAVRLESFCLNQVLPYAKCLLCYLRVLNRSLCEMVKNTSDVWCLCLSLSVKRWQLSTENTHSVILFFSHLSKCPPTNHHQSDLSI